MQKTALFLDPSVHRGRIFPYRRSGYLIRGDGLAFLASLKPDIADIVFLDPPFNLGKDYGIRSSLESSDPETYYRYLCRVVEQSARVLKPGGAIFLYHLPAWAARFAAAMTRRLAFRHWIAISMKNGFVRGKRLYPAHYALLYFTKGQPRSFHRPRHRPAICRHCKKLVKNYGGYTSIIEEKGINLSDFWEDVSPVRHKSTKHRASNQLPSVLTDRIVSIAGVPGGLLVDPFAGTGTALVSALRADMWFLGNDLATKNLTICRERLDDLLL